MFVGMRGRGGLLGGVIRRCGGWVMGFKGERELGKGVGGEYVKIVYRYR